MELQCPNATQVQAVRGAIERGVLTWHAFPFNSEMELCVAARALRPTPRRPALLARVCAAHAL